MAYPLVQIPNSSPVDEQKSFISKKKDELSQEWTGFKIKTTSFVYQPNFGVKILPKITSSQRWDSSNARAALAEEHSQLYFNIMTLPTELCMFVFVNISVYAILTTFIVWILYRLVYIDQSIKVISHWPFVAKTEHILGLNLACSSCIIEPDIGSQLPLSMYVS